MDKCLLDLIRVYSATRTRRMPKQLHIHDEKFNQPLFLCNNISGLVEPHRALYSTHAFKILFKEGGCGTFVPLFFNLIKSVRQYSQQYASREEQRADPLQAAQTPRHTSPKNSKVAQNI
ncbi:hypothetical protein CsSME_00030913 [Camellia sinensis var. sinensis]